MSSQQDLILNWADQVLIARLQATAFVTGAGGVGKSKIIAEIKKKYAGACLVTALMAKVACAIGGKTLHSAFKIPIAGVISGILEERQLDGITILTIDEVALLDMYLINQIDQILRKAKKTEQPFGGLITVLFVDFLQLPPINTSTNQKEELKYIFDSHIWKNIVTFVLTKNMRTNEDPTYGDVLLRWREGEMIGEEQSFLKERSISSRLNTCKDYEIVAKK
ncbi:hypothetical protein CRE_09855 [Caenorhabditis remanei]|uniref:ATP-dependent DNA helicase n=1 Tax=Caenorhabditis remanei TaxID=31234 RepID=E3NJY6_CAERE|nr:hypothetical protein CRE_09855 [Caenorhabditis remanei]